MDIKVVTAPPVRPQVTEIVIRLNDAEARVLHRVVSQIGGQPTGPRQVTQQIYDALAEVYGGTAHLSRRGINGSIFIEPGMEVA